MKRKKKCLFDSRDGVPSNNLPAISILQMRLRRNKMNFKKSVPLLISTISCSGHPLIQMMLFLGDLAGKRSGGVVIVDRTGREKMNGDGRP
jgi:hypothetical protein